MSEDVKLTVRELPLIPVKDVVLYPHMIIPLFLGREKSIRAIEEASKREKILIIAAQKDSKAENPGPDDIYRVGTAAQVLQVLQMPDATWRIVVQGLARAKLVDFPAQEPCLVAAVEELQEEDVPDQETEALVRLVVNQFKQAIEMGKFIPPEMLVAVINIKDPGHLADVTAFHLDLTVAEKQEILEILNTKERLKKANEFLFREMEMLKLESRIQTEARKDIEKSHREFLLRKQLRAIQEELGLLDEGRAELNLLRSEIEKAGMPEEARAAAEKELEKLERIPHISPEHSVVRTYLDWLIRVPWSKKTEDRLDIEAAARILDEDHYGLKEVKERILEFLAVRQLARSNMKGQILCFVGPPGVGKTSLGRSIARALGRKFIRISLGGVRDEAEIRGHRRTYIGALPGRIIQAICQTGSRNPLFMMDEIDKIGLDFRGDPSAALLEALDPEQNYAFKDHYLEVSFDLSEVMFILTANILDTIPPALKDRMEVIHLPGYTEEEKIQIAIRFLLQKQKKAHGLGRRKLVICEEALREILRKYTREAGVRNLERSIANICRKTARAIVEKKKVLRHIGVDDLHGFLGIPKYPYGIPKGEEAVGTAKGLSWTEAGGEVLSVEATILRGKGNVHLTGYLGEIMKESAQAAMSFVRSKCQRKRIPFDFHRSDVHVHVPAGAIPKDGPSAGVTIATAVFSAVTGTPVRGDLAMTGEITLRGKVLPVGGIKEKILAAHSSGIMKVILPDENEKNLEEIPDHVRANMKFRFVKDIDEVFKIALHAPRGRKKGKARRRSLV